MDEQKAKEYVADLNEQLQSFPKNADEWTTGHLLKLKHVLRNVHAHITYLAGKAFLDSLGVAADFDYDQMYNNGFDIEIHRPDLRLLAEIKVNLPVNDNHTRYGAAQEDGIKKDINGLLNGKKKAKNKAFKANLPNGTYRFLVLPDNNRAAFDALLRKLRGEGGTRGPKPKRTYDRTELVVHQQPFSLNDVKPDVINVVFVKL